MYKDKLNFKLVNFAILAVVIFFIYTTSNLWLGIITKTWSLIMPFFFGFVIAYAFYPFVKLLKSKGVPKGLAILFIYLVIVGVLALMILTVFPVLFAQLPSLFNNVLEFFKDLTTKYNINFGDFQNTLSTSFDDIIKNLGKYISSGAVSFINMSLGIFATLFMMFITSIYFLIDMERIRRGISNFFSKKSKKTYEYVKSLDREMLKYLTSFIKIMGISFIEYTLAYKLIGHPNALLLGFLAIIGNLIPYFGGIFVNIVAGITAFAISPTLFFRTVITFVILSMFDGYVLNPYIYGKNNKVIPLIGIFGLYTGAYLFGFTGMIISMPIIIISMVTVKTYSKGIMAKIEGKNNPKEETPQKNKEVSVSTTKKH